MDDILRDLLSKMSEFVAVAVLLVVVAVIVSRHGKTKERWDRKRLLSMAVMCSGFGLGDEPTLDSGSQMH